ncbi:MAG: exopolysaccharide transport family protein [Proteobacteria bacterium]|nr:exopolysaccharide transport family protein [Pseudomonadota bacterium]
MYFIRYQEADDYPPQDRFDDPRGADVSDGVQMAGLSDLIEILRRRAVLILGIVAAIMIMALVVVERMTPIYEGEVLIQLETRETNVVDIESVLSGAATDTAGVYSERELLMSPALAARVVDDLDLINERGLSPLHGEGPGFFARLWSGAFGGDRSPELSPEVVRSIVIARVRENMSAEPVGRSRVIRLAYRSPSASLAARVANGLADAYIDQQLEAKYRATDGASIWLEGRIEELRGKVEETEAKVAAFRQNAGLVQAETTTITAQQISEINTQLVEARARRAEAEARLRQVAGMKGRPDGLASISEVLGSPLIQQLRKQQAEVEQRASELGTHYGPEHPKVINIAGEISEIRTKISTEVDRIIQGLQNEVQVSRARENSISDNLDQLQGKLNGMDGALVELRAMEREAAANRTLYETFVARFKETSEQRDLQQSDSQIFSRAEVPLGPVWPRRDIILIGALSAGLILALAIVFAIEHLDHGFRSVDQIEQMTGRSALGIVPQVCRGLKERARVVDEVADGPSSMFSESIRTILTALLLTQKGGRPKIVLFTSSVAKEGRRPWRHPLRGPPR